MFLSALRRMRTGYCRLLLSVPMTEESGRRELRMEWAVEWRASGDECDGESDDECEEESDEDKEG